MDEWHFELAQRNLEHAIEDAIDKVRHRQVLHPKGACFNCEEALEPFSGKLFCDTDCRDDFEKRHRRR